MDSEDILRLVAGIPLAQDAHAQTKETLKVSVDGKVLSVDRGSPGPNADPLAILCAGKGSRVFRFKSEREAVDIASKLHAVLNHYGHPVQKVIL